MKNVNLGGRDPSLNIPVGYSGHTKALEQLKLLNHRKALIEYRYLLRILKHPTKLGDVGYAVRRMRFLGPQIGQEIPADVLRSVKRRLVIERVKRLLEIVRKEPSTDPLCERRNWEQYRLLDFIRSELLKPHDISLREIGTSKREWRRLERLGLISWGKKVVLYFLSMEELYDDYSITHGSPPDLAANEYMKSRDSCLRRVMKSYGISYAQVDTTAEAMIRFRKKFEF
jgi:hypothetical protein